MTEYAGSDSSASWSLERAPGLELRLNTPKGKGVFATKSISKGSVVDVCPVLIFSEDEVQNYTSQTCLQHYTYYWPSTNGNTTTQAIALGLGSMFNHSTMKQNVVWKRDIKAQRIIYTARWDIDVGEELCISYGNGRLWFTDADAANLDDDLAQLGNSTNAADNNEIVLSGISSIDI